LWLVLVVWAALTAAALGFVVTFGTNTPFADEWEFIPALTGHEPIGTWLWQQHNEHRLPLPRAIYLGLFRLTHDFRAGMVVQVVLLSGLSFGLTRLAARLRGRGHWADVFFPASLLHVGHWENLLMGYQLCFVLFTVFTTAIGVVALRTTRNTAYRSGVTAGILGFLLCLCGGFGVVVALPVGAWVAYLAVAVWRGGSKSKAVQLLALAGLPVLYLVLYRIGYERPPHHPPPGHAPATAVVMVAAEAITMAMGSGTSAVWAWVFSGLVGIGTLTIGTLVAGPNRPAAFGLIAVFVGVLGLALAIGVGRAGFGDEMGLWSRYSLLMWPLIGLSYLAWVKHGGRGGKRVPVLLCVAVAVFFQANTQTGLALGEAVRQRQAGIEADAAAGVPPGVIAARWLNGSGQEERAVRGIPMLRDAKVGLFAGN
jgi:hypothetical protein